MDLPSPQFSNSHDADDQGIVLAEANRALDAIEVQPGQRCDRGGAIAALADRERLELQRVLQESALDHVLFDNPATAVSSQFGAVIDVAALRRSSEELDRGHQRSSAVNANPETAVQTVRELTDLLSPERAFLSVHNTADVRLQQAMPSAREDERRRLAHKVHDGPPHAMANATFAIEIAEQIAKRAPDHVAKELNRVRTLLNEGVAEIRRFMFDLLPTMVQDRGLGPTLRRYGDDDNRFIGKRVELNLEEPHPV
ncbi:MAG: hypothetical protein AVDCRST_MAG73-2221 [uncultured Thermomicrobiales bacterium]|uniref:Signal transduction histidine kinase subgroup 3 dimerisation and phosphoacceptor domain-containing protein n=1 Tax=uncultured Thermomicrobiales bacterium TaxID=1645740 RepID=A0A6J4UBN0_9BACT|nr:MAG: hypothetical protein AVDCRST_MAG73-2221 [uncultured Thermomicrobiales bacterium]